MKDISKLALKDLQPSQFYISEKKLTCIRIKIIFRTILHQP